MPETWFPEASSVTDPAGQRTQSETLDPPSVSKYVPAGQSSHDSWPSVDEYLPVGQMTQSEGLDPPSVFKYLPTGQLSHDA